MPRPGIASRPSCHDCIARRRTTRHRFVGVASVNILVATSEAVPFAKTGGLADVCGALPTELVRLGHRAALILPCYRQARCSGMPIEPMGIRFIVPIGSKTVTGQLLRSRLPAGDVEVPVYLIQQDEYYDRDELYRHDGEDYSDNCERFIFFSRAVLEAIRLLELDVDIIHVNDWQTCARPRVPENRIPPLPRYEQHRQPADDPQHRLSGHVLALGHAPDRTGLEVLQLAPDGVLRQAQPA